MTKLEERLAFFIRACRNKKKLGLAGSLFLFLLFYGVALNPYFLPDVYDNIVYFFGAKSLATTGSFLFEGNYVADWPPGFSVLLAIPMALGLQTVLVSKIVVMLCACSGTVLAFQLLKKEQRPFPFATSLILALIPTAFMQGTRIMAEWPFMTVSLAFLNLLEMQRTGRRKIGFAVMTGAVLGAASLTRWMGVMLGAAVVAQAISILREKEKRSILPEIVVAGVGAGLFCLWRLKLQWQVQHGEATFTYYNGWDFLTHFDLVALLCNISDLLLGIDTLIDFLGLSNAFSKSVALISAIVMLSAFGLRWRRGKLSPADWYVVATLVLLVFAQWKHRRYLLPIAPFLISYFIEGATWCIDRYRRRSNRPATWIRRSAIMAWIALLVAFDCFILFVGNSSRTHRGLSLLVSPNAENFYVGYWRDLYEICQIIKHSPGNDPVVVIGMSGKYVLAFSDRPYTSLSPPGTHLDRISMICMPSNISKDTSEDLSLQKVWTSSSVALYTKTR